MSIGELGRLERRPSSRGDEWEKYHDTYPDAGNRFRTYTTRKPYGSEQSGRATRTLGDLGDDDTSDDTSDTSDDTSDTSDDGGGGGSDWDSSGTAATTTSDTGFFADLGEVLGAGACFRGVDANLNLCGPDVPGVAGTTPGSPVSNAIQQLQAPSTAWSFLGSGGGNAPASSLVSTIRLAVIGVVVVAAAVAVAEVASATKTVATVRKHT